MSLTNKTKEQVNNVRFYFTFTLWLLYLFFGILFLFTNVWKELIPEGRTTIGTILFLFGMLRFFVAYRRYKNKKMKIDLVKEN